MFGMRVVVVRDHGLEIEKMPEKGKHTVIKHLHKIVFALQQVVPQPQENFTQGLSTGERID